MTLRDPFLSGEGILIAVLDSGIAYQRQEFRKSNGDTRIRFLWDQTLGREFSETEINQALQAATEQERFQVVPSADVSGHGTAVAGIAAGYVEDGSYTGIATRADLLIVKLGLPGESGFPRTTEIMRGVTYALRKAEELQMPLVINLSFGNSYGSNDGSSLLERFLDNAAEVGRRGNRGSKHATAGDAKRRRKTA